MLIVGAKGFAIQITDVLQQVFDNDSYVYFDDTLTEEKYFLSKFKIVRSVADANDYLSKVDNRFVLGIGNPLVRKRFFSLFQPYGQPLSVISPYSKIGTYDVSLGEGCCVLTNAVIESTVTIGKGTLINLNAIITHGCSIGAFCEIGPGVQMSGDCTIGDGTSIGTGAIVLPKINIGDHVVIGAGAVITKDIPSNVVVKGIPGKISNRQQTVVPIK